MLKRTIGMDYTTERLRNQIVNIMTAYRMRPRFAARAMVATMEREELVAWLDAWYAETKFARTF